MWHKHLVVIVAAIKLGNFLLIYYIICFTTYEYRSGLHQQPSHFILHTIHTEINKLHLNQRLWLPSSRI